MGQNLDRLEGQGAIPRQQFLANWVQSGVEAWAAVLDLERSRIALDDLARLRRLVERFGAQPRAFGDKSRERFRSRWRKGLLRELLGQAPVLVPVCPSAIEHTATQLGYTGASQPKGRKSDIEEITAIALFEHGSVHKVGQDEWQAIREVLALSDAVIDLFSGPPPGLQIP